jgi:hypothetical protein
MIWWREFKKGFRCSKCGEDHPACIDFHHVKDKTMNVSKLLTYGNKKRIVEEVKKCIPLCSNCHRKHHYEERKREKNDGS